MTAITPRSIRMKGRHSVRMNVPEETVIQHAAAMIALIGHRKTCKRWRMSKQNVRALCQRPIRAQIFQQLSDCLAEYGVMIMDNSDVEFSFVKTEIINGWYRCGISALTDEERLNPNLSAMEDEFGYTESFEDDHKEDPRDE